jgi:hypothetical protein
MNDGNMSKITIKLNNEAEDLLRKRTERNKRSISKEFEHIVETIEKHKIDILNPFFPVQSKDKVK